jgi:hypothetical protein
MGKNTRNNEISKVHSSLTVTSIKVDQADFVRCIRGDDLIALRRKHPDIDGVIVYESEGSKPSEPLGVAWMSGKHELLRGPAEPQVMTE